MLSVNVENMPFYRMGIQEGIERGIEKVAIAMLKTNMSVEIIQKTTGLSLQKIEILKKRIK